MMTNKGYTQALEQAKINLADIRERGEGAIGGDVLDLFDKILTPEEKADSDLKVGLMMERGEGGVSQRRLKKLKSERV